MEKKFDLMKKNHSISCFDLMKFNLLIPTPLEREKILRFCMSIDFYNSTRALLKSTPDLFYEWLKKDSEKFSGNFQRLIRSAGGGDQIVDLIKKSEHNEKFVEQASAKLSKIFAFNLKCLKVVNKYK
jgi:hypothetical protein